MQKLTQLVTGGLLFAGLMFAATPAMAAQSGSRKAQTIGDEARKGSDSEGRMGRDGRHGGEWEGSKDRREGRHEGNHDRRHEGGDNKGNEGEGDRGEGDNHRHENGESREFRSQLKDQSKDTKSAREEAKDVLAALEDHNKGDAKKEARELIRILEDLKKDGKEFKTEGKEGSREGEGRKGGSEVRSDAKDLSKDQSAALKEARQVLDALQDGQRKSAKEEVKDVLHILNDLKKDTSDLRTDGKNHEGKGLSGELRATHEQLREKRNGRH